VQLVGPSIIRLHHQPTVTYDYYCSIAPRYDDPISNVSLFVCSLLHHHHDDVVLPTPTLVVVGLQHRPAVVTHYCSFFLFITRMHCIFNITNFQGAEEDQARRRASRTWYLVAWSSVVVVGRTERARARQQEGGGDQASNNNIILDDDER
jgi:hypothetical protein